MKILIVDDAEAIRSRIGQLLQSDLVPISLGEAASGAEAVAKMQAEAWDAVVLDISMRQGSGLDVLHWRKSEAVSVPVVMQSMNIERATVKRCFDLGAFGFVAKSAIPDELVPAVCAITSGEMYLCREVIAAIGLQRIPALIEPSNPRHSKLLRFVVRQVRQKFENNRRLSTNAWASSQAVLEKSYKLLEEVQLSRRGLLNTMPRLWQ